MNPAKPRRRMLRLALILFLMCANAATLAFLPNKNTPGNTNRNSDHKELTETAGTFTISARADNLLTWACNKYGVVQTVGLCHEVRGVV